MSHGAELHQNLSSGHRCVCYECQFRLASSLRVDSSVTMISRLLRRGLHCCRRLGLFKFLKARSFYLRAGRVFWGFLFLSMARNWKFEVRSSRLDVESQQAQYYPRSIVPPTTTKHTGYSTARVTYQQLESSPMSGLGGPIA